MNKLLIVVTILITVGVVLGAPERRRGNPALEAQKERCRTLSKTLNVKHTLKNTTVDQIAGMSDEEKAYQKKINKIIKALWRDASGGE